MNNWGSKDQRALFGRWEAAAEGLAYGITIVCGSYLLVQILSLVTR